MKHEPLAFRMRPSSINEILGQKHLVGEGKPINEMLKKGFLSSFILYGKPGIGKTSIANAIANEIKMPFRKLNAVTNNKKDLEDVVKEAKKLEEPICLAVDEIHRFTKTQIEYLLPFVEDGTLKLIGLTSENPYHNIAHAIRSRCTIYELFPLTKEDIVIGLKRALVDEKNGLGMHSLSIEDEVLERIAISSGGDARHSLNVLEMAFLTCVANEEGRYLITNELLEEAVQKNNLSFDNDGDEKFDLLSFFHKSMRGSDVDSSILALSKLILGGDIIGISRRILCAAYEDCASSMIGVKALAAIEAAERLGFPEARIPLASIVVDICLSPKSNASYNAIGKALSIIQSGKEIKIPDHIRDGHYSGAQKLGRAIGYEYPHNYQKGKYGGWVAQQYLPEDLKYERFYEPYGAGEEGKMKKIHEFFKEEQYKLYKEAENSPK